MPTEAPWWTDDDATPEPAPGPDITSPPGVDPSVDRPTLPGPWDDDPTGWWWGRGETDPHATTPTHRSATPQSAPRSARSADPSAAPIPGGALWHKVLLVVGAICVLVSMGLLLFAPLGRRFFPDPTDDTPHDFGFSGLRDRVFGDWGDFDPRAATFWVGLAVAAGVVAVVAGILTERRRGAAVVLAGAALVATGAMIVATLPPRTTRSITSFGLEVVTGHLQAAIWLLIVGLAAMLIVAGSRWPERNARQATVGGMIITTCLGMIAVGTVYTDDDLQERWRDQRREFGQMHVFECSTRDVLQDGDLVDTAILFAGGDLQLSSSLERLDEQRATITAANQARPTIDGRPLVLRLGLNQCPAEGSEAASVVGDTAVALSLLNLDRPEARDLGFGRRDRAVFVYRDDGRLGEAQALVFWSDPDGLLFDVFQAADRFGSDVDWERIDD